MIVEHKKFFLGVLKNELPITEDTKILELGCGQAKAIIPTLETFPDLLYVGVEPDKKSAQIATEGLKKFRNAKIFNQLAYEKIKGYGPFDLCLSLSVLEHVKQLEKFLVTSVESVRPGGHIIHRYDLGHALYPDSLKEKLQIFLGNNLPGILPENKFVRYLAEQEVCKILKDNGAGIEKITYHQMPSHKAFLKIFNVDTAEKEILAKTIMKWELDVSKYLPELEQKKREFLFPAITVWAIKK